eukprot:9066429-Pyramimonas_sp.AAC.1
MWGASGFMRRTRALRASFVSLLLLASGLATCPYPIVQSAEAWFTVFCGDHDAEFLCECVTSGLPYDFEDADPGGESFSVPNYVSEEHASKVDDWVSGESSVGRYVKVPRSFVRGTSAIG